MSFKVCSKCCEDKPLADFYGDKRAKDGKQSQCKSCHKNFYKTDHGKSVKRDSYNPTKRSMYHQENKDRENSRNAEYYRNNRAERLSYGKRHYQQNKSKYAEYTRTRQAKIIERTPNWLSPCQKAEIQNFYWLSKDLTAVSGEIYHVDHIVPLQGKNICGLHVPWNLQILPADINLSKGNSYANDA